MKLDGLKILIAEDEPLIALDIEHTLSSAGAEVKLTARSNAELAVLLEGHLQDGSWDAVVLDFQLRDGTTEDVAAAFKEIGLPFVIHSGLSEKIRPLAKKLDAPLVAKPAADGALVAAIIRAIT